MNSLRVYLASLSLAEQIAYAKRSGTSLGYLRKALSVNKRNPRPKFGGALARRLDEESNGAVSRFELRADIFGSAPEEQGDKAA